MRRISARRAALIERASPYREALRDTCVCEACGQPTIDGEVHEVCCGTGLRELQLDKPFSSLLLCPGCHRPLLHDLPKAHGVAIGLALIQRSRPGDSNREHFFRLMARRWPDEALIDRWERILNVRARTF